MTYYTQASISGRRGILTKNKSTVRNAVRLLAAGGGRNLSPLSSDRNLTVELIKQRYALRAHRTLKISWLYNGRFGAVASISASKNWITHTARLRSPWQQRCGIIIMVSSPNWGSVRPRIWAGHTAEHKLVGMLISHQYLIFSSDLMIRCPVCDIVSPIVGERI